MKWERSSWRLVKGSRFKVLPSHYTQPPVKFRARLAPSPALNPHPGTLIGPLMVIAIEPIGGGSLQLTARKFKFTNRMKTMKLLLTIGLAPVMASLCSLDAAQPGEKLWEFNASGYCPAIGADGTVYVDSGYLVYALNGATGQKRWEFLKIRSGDGCPAIGADGTVYVDSGYLVYALNGATGQKIWEFQPGGGVHYTPAIGADATVYVGSANGKVYALNGATGQIRWELNTGRSVDSCPVIGADGTVYMGSFYQPTILALSGATGGKLWQYDPGGNSYTPPAIGADGTLCFATEFQTVYTVNAYGQKLWEYQPGGSVYTSLAIGTDGTMYFALGYPGRIYALNGVTRQKRWEFQTGTNSAEYSTPAIGADATVYVGSANGKVYALNGATGQKQWEFQTGGEVNSSPTIGADGTVYVGSGGKLYALSSSSVGGLARSAWPKFRGDAQNTGRSTVTRPFIDTPPSPAILQEGSQNQITAQVSGKPTPQIQWFFNGTAVPGGTYATLILPAVTRAMEGMYWLVASNAVGKWTSDPIAAVVSNVDPEHFVRLQWTGHIESGLSLESTDRLGPGAAWHTLSNYPPAAMEQRFLEPEAAGARFYLLSGSGASPRFSQVGIMNGLRYVSPAGIQHQIDYTAASTGWTNWLLLTNLVLPTSPYLFLDEASLGAPTRVYRTTPLP